MITSLHYVVVINQAVAGIRLLLLRVGHLMRSAVKKGMKCLKLRRQCDRQYQTDQHEHLRDTLDRFHEWTLSVHNPSQGRQDSVKIYQMQLCCT